MKKQIKATTAKVWKMRYAFEFCHRTKLSWKEGWASAGAMLDDTLNGDFTEIEPVDAVAEELSCWADGSDDV
jgi:hypothetical protein